MSKKVDPSLAVGFEFPPTKVAFNKRDLLLYAVGIGASEPSFAYENSPSFGAFPTYPVVLSLKGSSSDVVPFGLGGTPVPGIPQYDPSMILHGEQSLEVLRTLPASGGSFTLRTRIIGVHDKGKGMLMEQESVLVGDQDAATYARLVAGIFVRGLGGFDNKDKSAQSPAQKQAPQPSKNVFSTPPHAEFEFKTGKDQALLYRLSGDYNPLHADAALAKRVGFPAPILHGLCSFGIAARGIITHFCGGDATRFKAIRVRFSSPVFPGETLVTQMWKVDAKTVAFQTKVKERDIVAISNSFAEIIDAPAARL